MVVGDQMLAVWGAAMVDPRGSIPTAGGQDGPAPQWLILGGAHRMLALILNGLRMRGRSIS